MNVVTPNSAGSVGSLSLRAVGLILIVDQLLLPMFHIGGMPFKISYLLLAMWFAQWLNLPAKAADSRSDADFRDFSVAIGVIVLSALCGELIFAIWYPVPSYSTSVRSIAIYVLVAFAFGLGCYSRRFEPRWLVPLLITAVAANLVFIYFRRYLPGWIIDLYYPPDAIANLALGSAVDARDVLELARPRGLFGNPNQSALMVNIIALLIHVCLRAHLLRIRSSVVSFGIILGPMLVSASVASRGEFIVACVLSVLNFWAMMPSWGRAARARAIVIVCAAPILGISLVATSGVPDAVVDNFNRVLAVVEILDRPTSTGEERQESIARPLVFLEFAIDRIRFSPVFGTGFSSSTTPPFEYKTDYFHNDWLRLFVTSGSVGVFTMIYIIVRFCLPLGWPMVIPFILPGTINTFQMSIPAFIFYFFMVASVRTHVRATTAMRLSERCLRDPTRSLARTATSA